jgi:endonuclease/exonuclease/phosphatase family metal-dependent hydrolase
VQDHLRKHGAPNDLTKFERQILESSDKTRGDRGYQQTLEAIKPLLAAKETIVLTGDFNEPSHLDWTARAAKDGMDRWVKNATNVPLRLPIRWTGSRLLADVGLRDAYRTAHRDEVQHPGNTWTPPYPENTPGRRPYVDQVLDRIDMIYFAGPGLRVRSAAVIGESQDVAEVVFDGRWPSDHRAVLAVFDIVP